MILLVVFDVINGKIKRNVACAEDDVTIQAGVGEAVYTTTVYQDPRLRYVNTSIFPSSGALTDRPSPPTPTSGFALLVTNTWTGLPVGATVTVIDPDTGLSAGSIVVDGAGEAQVRFEVAGNWLIQVSEAFPLKARTLTVTVA